MDKSAILIPLVLFGIPLILVLLFMVLGRSPKVSWS